MFKKVVGFPSGLAVKNLPAKQDMWVCFLGQEEPPLEYEMQPISVLPGKSHGQRNLVGYNLWSHKRV